MQKIVIIGASGQGKNIALLLEQVGSYDIIGFVDDDHLKKGSIVKGYPVMGSFAEVFSSLDNIADNVAVAFSIGNSDVVEKMVRQLKSMEKGIFFPNIVHPSVQIDATSVRLGEGNIFNAYCVVTADITIGNFNYFNRCCSISHDTIIGDYNFVHAGVHPCGGLRMGSKNWLGVGSVVIQGVKIGNNATIGAGAVVLKDVEDNAVMVGNPAKLLKYKEPSAAQASYSSSCSSCGNISGEVKRT
ncbi:MAG TPA: acetyltransferase [Candidatus Nanoarchaeia archaeon]|nr:acetyltransferase [Candidatus Nanoarchaeia archaeon]